VRTDKLRTILGQMLAADGKHGGVTKQGRKVTGPWVRKDAAEGQEVPTTDTVAESGAPTSDD